MLVGFLFAAVGFRHAVGSEPALPAKPGVAVDFNRDIRPILSEHCYTCHGPDEGKRKGGLRLDRREDAFRELKSGHRALVAGDPARSTLVSRILTRDPDDLMPPIKGGKPLTPVQIELLRRWVAGGAVWSEHWSFMPPRRPVLPEVKDRRWVRNPVDRFVLARLEREGLKPNPEADPVTLLRRVTLDLTGLPPTVEDVDSYLRDRSGEAYERRVDRLLHSAHYAERMAANWLDLARYADTSGYHFDGVRFMWLWRDWVIDAFQRNKPYDAFTVEQLAGDLLPNPTPEQRVATGFVRNNMTNDEGGADPDEYLNKYVVDRVNTLGAVWLGLTVGCTECHDHKYDPMTTREFYRLYAFFHNVPEKGLDRIRTDNPPPRLPMPTAAQARDFVEADFRLRDAEKTLTDRVNELGETQEKWERETIAHPPAGISTNGLALRLEVATPPRWTVYGAGRVSSIEGVVSAGHDFPSSTNAGRAGMVYRFEKGPSVRFAIGTGFGGLTNFSLAGWVRPVGGGVLLSGWRAGDTNAAWWVDLNDGKVRLELRGPNADQVFRVRTKEAIGLGTWHHLAILHDFAKEGPVVRVFVDGRLTESETEKKDWRGGLPETGLLWVSGDEGQTNRFSGDLGAVRLYSRVLGTNDLQAGLWEGFFPIVSRSRGNRSEEERADLARFYKTFHAVDYLRAEAALAGARRAKDQLIGAIPTSLIMEEMDPPRPTHVLVRGDFRNKGERVGPGTPAFLPPLPPGPTNRLALARWLVAPEHPLASRVTVNRYWAMLFGNGLVKTANDLGSQGEWPSHPELLDWLAVQFRDGGVVAQRVDRSLRHRVRQVPAWDVRELVRLVVTSATYRQSAAAPSDKLEKDLYNRLLARGPHLRLEAEFIRDNALAISGLLNDKVGGASVKPYQPAGIWDGTDSRYDQDHGADLYRRGMYVFWRRSAHYPSFAAFDAPNREVCTFLRQRTQTPLQSLVLMNDPVFVEAARALAQRVLREEPASLERRLVRAFRLTLARRPGLDEVAVLRKTYEAQLGRFREEPAAVDAFLKVGESKPPEGVRPDELAALAAVANVLLNLNEAITK